MGCCISQKFKPELEINSSENKLEVKSISLERIDKLIRKYSDQNKKISPENFTALCKALQLEVDSLSHSYFKMFYHELEKTYHTRELISAGILYC